MTSSDTAAAALHPPHPPCVWGLAGPLLQGAWLLAFREPPCVQGVSIPARRKPQAPTPLSLVGSQPRPDEDAQAIFSRNKWREIALTGEQPLFQANFHIIESNDFPSFLPTPLHNLTNCKAI